MMRRRGDCGLLSGSESWVVSNSDCILQSFATSFTEVGRHADKRAQLLPAFGTRRNHFATAIRTELWRIVGVSERTIRIRANRCSAFRLRYGSTVAKNDQENRGRPHRGRLPPR